jgi:hypothetical protein
MPANAPPSKFLIVTAFADAADDLYEHVVPFFLEKKRLRSGMLNDSDGPKSALK